MATSPWDEDDELLEELRAAVRQAGTPTPAMVAAGAASSSWATVDADLAALTHDSLVDRVAGVHGTTTGPRDLVFEGRQLSVEVEQEPHSLLGQLVPPSPGQVTLLGPDGELARTDADELGRFRFERSISGLVRLRCATPAGVVLTEWIRL
jgi:hypothetical protein